MKEIDELLNNLNIKDDKIIVACSGGPDSMFLLYTFKNKNYNIVCAHVNHHLRVESDQEYEMVKKYCIDNNIIFEGIELHNLPKNNTEIVARMKRYDFFEKLIKKYNSKYLFTAHHGDDLMETVLMRIVRGSSLNGYSGFNIITDKKYYKIVRPLVYLTKDEILNECNRIKIPYAIDSTNLDDNHTRNRYRHHILPILKEEDPNVHLKFLKYHKVLQSYYQYVNKIVYDNMNIMFKNNILDLNLFNKLDDLIKFNMLNEIIRIYYPDNLYLIKDSNIDEILKIINSNKPNIKLVLPNNLNVIKEYNKLIFKFNNNINKLDKMEIKDITNLNNNMCIKIVNNSNDTSNYTIRLNSMDIKMPLYVRGRCNGDFMYVKNLNGKKKLKEIFIESHIPVDERNNYPIVVDSNDNILWIPGIKKSKFDIQINSKYDIILSYAERKDLNEKK